MILGYPYKFKVSAMNATCEDRMTFNIHIAPSDMPRSRTNPPIDLEKTKTSATIYWIEILADSSDRGPAITSFIIMIDELLVANFARV